MSEPKHNLYGILTICKTNQSTTNKVAFLFRSLMSTIFFMDLKMLRVCTHTHTHKIRENTNFYGSHASSNFDEMVKIEFV